MVMVFGEGFLVEIEGGDVLCCELMLLFVGMRFEVWLFFYNVLVWCVFFKCDVMEMCCCVEVVQGYVLVYLEILFCVCYEGKEVFDVLCSGSDVVVYFEWIVQFFGVEFVLQFIEICGSLMVGGFVGVFEIFKGCKFFVFVNGCLLKDCWLFLFFYCCVWNEWKIDCFLLFFFYLVVLEELVDVNVYFQKVEVCFCDEVVFGIVYNVFCSVLQEVRGEVFILFGEVQLFLVVELCLWWDGFGVFFLLLLLCFLDDLMLSVFGL